MFRDAYSGHVSEWNGMWLGCGFCCLRGGSWPVCSRDGCAGLRVCLSPVGITPKAFGVNGPCHHSSHVYLTCCLGYRTPSPTYISRWSNPRCCCVTSFTNYLFLSSITRPCTTQWGAVNPWPRLSDPGSCSDSRCVIASCMHHAHSLQKLPVHHSTQLLLCSSAVFRDP